MAADARHEELEVLQSILADDFQEISEDEWTVRVIPEDEASSQIILLLRTRLTPNYPDELPGLSIDVAQEGNPEEDEDDAESEARLSEEDIDTLLRRLKEAGEESLGLAMVYTLAMQLKESLTELLVAKAAAKELEEQAEQLRIQEEELAKPKGTPVTVEAFLAWRKKFDIEMREKKKKELEEELKALPGKERKEKEAFFARPSGKQIFQQKKMGGTVEEEAEDDAQELDLSKFEREQRQEEEEEEQNVLVLSDSD